MKSDDSNYLRIEVGSKYYIVRLGRFGDRLEAQKVLEKVKSFVPDAFILKETDFDRAEVLIYYDSDGKPSSILRKNYTVQTGPFAVQAEAQRKFDSISHTFPGNDLEKLRIIKEGDSFLVRAGMYQNRTSADKFLKRMSEFFPDAVIVETRINDEKVITSYSVSAPSNIQVMEKDGLPPESASITTSQPVKMIPTEKEDLINNILNEVSDLFYRQEYAQAAELLKKSLARWPDEPDLHAWYGATLLDSGYPDEAFKEYRKAADLMPNVPDFHSGIGHSLLDIHVDRAKKSVEAFRKALTMDPNNISALEGLGIVYVSIDKKYLATQIYHRLRGLDPAAAERLNQFIVWGLDWGNIE